MSDKTTTSSLVFEHWQLVLLLTFNLVMMDMNAIFTSFLLVQTSAGCTYHEMKSGAYVQSQTVALVAVLLWRGFSSLLTDALPNRNHLLLLGTLYIYIYIYRFSLYIMTISI